MSLPSNYDKFKKHLSSGGIFYAFSRGVKYPIFLLRRKLERLYFKKEQSIVKGKFKIQYLPQRLSVFYDNQPVTEASGLSSAINSLGSWLDSSNGKWKLLKITKDSLKIKVSHKNSPISQIWFLKLDDQQSFSWRVDLKIRKPVHIDEICILSALNPRYKTWINNYEQNNFPAFNNQWTDLHIGNKPAYLLGVRFPALGEYLPAFAIEFDKGNLLPLVKNYSSSSESFHVIGFRHTEYKSINKCPAGKSTLLTCKAYIFPDEKILDEKIENLRSNSLQKAITEIKVNKSENKLEVLLVNLPWQKENRQGVRAGSRWPHLRDVSEGEYLPFPFFLAYATSLLKKNGINAYIIDAIAEKTSEEDFLEIVLSKDIDFIVAETSVPSFYDDLRLLKRIAEFGVSIILCGPNYEIFKPEFLKEHSFISFVLYGEYELTLLELIKALQQRGKLSDINGLIYNDDGIIKKNPPRTHFDLDILPWPQRETLPIYSYLDAPGGMRTPCAQILASRGCPFKCQFCLWPQVIYQGNHYRARNIKDVIDEMEYMVRSKGFKSVYFDDDTFNVGRKRMVDFCNEIRKRGLNKIQWSIMARADLMDEGLLLNFKKAGLHSVKYGVESAVQSLVDGIGKDMDLKKAEKMIRFTQKLGIKVHLTFTFGLPGETRQTIQKTIDWAKSINPFSVQFSIVTPFPGTEYYKIMKEKGLIVSNDFSCYDGHSKSVIKLENLSPFELESAKAYSYKVWEEHLRKRRNLRSDAAKYFRYAKSNGFVPSLLKVHSYFKKIWNNKRLPKFIRFVKNIGLGYALRYFNKINLNEEHIHKAKKIRSSSNDIMLIQSPPWDIAMPPLGIAYLASNLKKFGYKVKVFDLNVALYNSVAKDSSFLWEQKSFDWWVDQENFVKTWEKTFGITSTLIGKALANAGTKIIGLSVNFASIKFSSKLIKMIKDKNPNIKIIVGGWATYNKHMRSLLPTELIDCIIVGEGERTLPDALKALTRKNNKDVYGAIFPKSKEKVFQPRKPVMNLNRISWPTFEEFDLFLYKHKVLPLFTSRGCISQCTFCNDWPFSKPYRSRSARNILNEIAYHVYENNITKFSFKDLLCNGDLNKLRILCDLIEKAELKICWDSQAIARKGMTYEFLCKLKKSGCGSLIYGAESFSNNVLKRMGKIFTSEILEEVLNNTYQAGIAALVNIIVGFPGESEEDFQETLEAIERNRKYLVKISAVSVCLINGGSDLDINYKKYGLLLPEDLRIRAKHWVSADGINNYNLRRNRVEKTIALFNKLGLTYETATI